MYKKNITAHPISERMVFKSWSTTIITTKTNLTTQTIWTTAITQAMQAAVQILVTIQTTLEKTQALTAAQALPKTNSFCC